MFASSETIAPHGEQGADDFGPVVRGERAARECREGGLGQGRERVRGHLPGQRFQSGDHVLGRIGEGVHLGALRYQVARLAGVGEERHRGAGARHDQVLDAVQLADGLLGEVAQTLDGGQARAALQSRGEGLRQRAQAGGVRDPAGREEPGLAAGRAADQQRGGFAAAQDVGDR